MSTSFLRAYGTLAARIFIGYFFLTAGLGKIGSGFGLGGGFAATAGYIAGVGLPAPELLAWGAIVFEVLGGIGLILGWYTKYAALMLAFVCAFTAFFFHGEIGDPMQKIQFMKNLSIAGGLLYIAAYGAGTSFSVDKEHHHTHN